MDDGTFLFDPDDQRHFDDNFLLERNFLDEAALAEFLAPPAEKWTNVDHTSVRTKVTVDDSKFEQWNLAKEEIKFILKNLRNVLELESNEKCTPDRIIMHILGPGSELGLLFQKQLSLAPDKYTKFIITICIQAAYKQTSTQLYLPASLISDCLPLNQAEYNEIWKTLATKKRLDEGFVGSGRRDKCIWEEIEIITNSLCRKISISNRDGKIIIAIDDDKIWVNLTGKNLYDTFGIRYSTHVKDNRKGIIAHTAVSTGANMPLGVVIERKKDSTADCFERLLNHLFQRNGTCDLNNVQVCSDRGYMVLNTVFGFILKNGGDFVGTTKRSAQCWPFTFDQKLRKNDERTLIESSGPPTLFVKKAKKDFKSIYSFAFRNGSNSVTTAVSSTHQNHHWEGIVKSPMDLVAYKNDPTCLRQKCIQRV